MKPGLAILAAILLLAACGGRTVAVPTASPTSHETTYVFAKTGFAVTYDPRVLKVEIDELGPKLGMHFSQVYFVSRLGPQRADYFPTNSDRAEVTVSRVDPATGPVATQLKEWVKLGRPFGSTVNVRWHLTTLDGMPGVTFSVKLSGERFLSYFLYGHGYGIDIRVAARQSAPAAVWPALEHLAQSIGTVP